MTYDEAQAIRVRCCFSKTRIRDKKIARKAARKRTNGGAGNMIAYECPFGHPEGGRIVKHWHIGHPAHPARVEQILQAARMLRVVHP